LLETNLSEARLLGADLSGAYLDGATVTNTQLNTTSSLEGAVTPDGFIRRGEGSQPTSGYTMVEHDSGTLAVEMPSEWKDTITDKYGTFEGTDVDPGDGIGPAITATTDLDGWETGRAEAPGVYILASTELATYTEDEFIDSRLERYGHTCESGPRQDFDQTPYSGKMQWLNCGAHGSTRLMLAVAPEDRECAI
jgi:hypothetical protein